MTSDRSGQSLSQTAKPISRSTRDLPPGPRGLPGIGVLHKMWRDPLGFFTATARDYGDIATIDFGSRYAFLLSHPAHIQHVLHLNDRNYRKSTTVKVVERVLGRGLATAEGELWLRQRRLMQPAFHHRRIAGLASVMTAQTETLLTRWQALARRGESIDLPAEMMRLTLSIIVRTMFGGDVGDAQNIDAIGHAWTVVLKHFNSQSWALFQVPENWPTPGNRRFQRALKLLDDTVYRIVSERRRAGRDAGDLLSILLQAQDEETGAGMTDRQLRDEVMTIFLAGHETTSNALSWTWYLLSQHPAVAERLRAELARVLNGRAPTFDDLPHLPYTRMVFDEALRLYPPFWLIYRAAYADDEIGGYRLAKNGMVLICTHVMHRHPDFWERPDVFDPERFAPDRAAERPKFVYFPFGGGPHQCIGNDLAVMEARLILATIAQRFDLRLVPGQRVEPEAMVTLRPKGGLRMILEPRAG